MLGLIVYLIRIQILGIDTNVMNLIQVGFDCFLISLYLWSSINLLHTRNQVVNLSPVLSVSQVFTNLLHTRDQDVNLSLVYKVQFGVPSCFSSLDAYCTTSCTHPYTQSCTSNEYTVQQTDLGTQLCLETKFSYTSQITQFRIFKPSLEHSRGFQ